MIRELAKAGVLLVSSAIIFGLWTSPVSAQCGVNHPDSACLTCHATETPINDNGEWHKIHARKDCCTNCHGGNCSATEKERAHEGLSANPLSDIYTSCHACHPNDYPERAARFATELNVIPASRETPTPVPLNTTPAPELVLESDLTNLPPARPPLEMINLGLLLIMILFLSLGRAEK